MYQIFKINVDNSQIGFSYIGLPTLFHHLGGQYINFLTLVFFMYFIKVLWNFNCTRMKHEQCPLVLSDIGGYLCFWSLVCHVDNITILHGQMLMWRYTFFVSKNILSCHENMLEIILSTIEEINLKYSIQLMLKFIGSCNNNLGESLLSLFFVSSVCL